MPSVTSLRLLPSYCHSWRPGPSGAVKYRGLPTAVRRGGRKWTEKAPTSVRLRPSYFHSCEEDPLSLAVKYRVLPTAVRFRGLGLDRATPMSFRRAAVL